MLREIEVFMPTLYPVVLESKAKPAPAARLPEGASPQMAHAALLQSYDATAAQALRKVLGELDVGKFSGTARDDLTMAERRLREGAAGLLPKGETATAVRLAVLTADWKEFAAGTLVHVQTTPSATIAYLAAGARARQAGGSVVLKRTVISLEAPGPKPHPMASSDKTADVVLRVAGMVASKIPGPYGQAAGAVVGAAGTLYSILDPQPSDVEIIIEAVIKAVTAAVAELEVFIVENDFNKNKAQIDAAYRWLAGAVDELVSATTLGEQMAFAHTALKRIPQLTEGLTVLLLYLPTAGVPANAKSNFAARTKALQLLALGAAALLTLDKMFLQFTAFAAANAADDEEDKVPHKNHVSAAYRALKIDILGDANRDLSAGPSWSLGSRSFVLTYSDMLTAVMRERAATITVSYFPFIGFSSVLIRDTSYGEDNRERWPNVPDSGAGGSWQGRLEQLGVRAPIARADAGDPAAFELQKQAYVNALCLYHMKEAQLREKYDALYSFVEKLPDWGKALSDWEKIVADAASVVPPAKKAG
jgi:hypothetical protein